VESLYLLIPLSIVLVLAIGGLLVWAALSGQFDGLDEEGRRILDDDDGRGEARRDKAGPPQGR